MIIWANKMDKNVSNEIVPKRDFIYFFCQKRKKERKKKRKILSLLGLLLTLNLKILTSSLTIEFLH